MSVAGKVKLDIKKMILNMLFMLCKLDGFIFQCDYFYIICFIVVGLLILLVKLVQALCP